MSTQPGTLDATDIARLSERDARLHLELLSTMSRVLADALEDYDDALADVASACVPDFCDLFAIEVIGDDGGTRVAAYRAMPTSRLEAPPRWTPAAQACAPDRRAVLGYGRADEPGPVRALRESLHALSIVVAPIGVAGVTFGWLVAATGPERRGFRMSALRLCVELSSRLGTAIQRVLLYREIKATSREQERAVQRLRRLAEAATGLAGADTPVAVLRVGCSEASVMQEADGAAARWWLADGREISAQVGDVDQGMVERALTSVSRGRPARGPGWVACPLPCTDPWQQGALAVFLGQDLSPDEELLLSSLASLIPVAFERAVGTEAAFLHEARLRAVLEASPIALVTVRPNGTVDLANEAAQRLFGWTSAPASWVVPDDVRPGVLKLTADVRGLGTVANRPVVTNRFDLSISGAPMPAVVSDDERSVVLAAADLTDRRKAERALVQAQRLEAMGQIAGRVAHDFNNLLTLIVGYGDILQRTLPGEREQEMLAKIDQAAKRAGALTRQMLGFTRRQVGDSVVIDVAGLLGGLRTVLDRLAGSGIALEVGTPPEAVKVRSDPSEMEQIVLNLAINACDAMEGSGRLSVALDVVDATSANADALGLPTGPYARLTVADTGPGMTQEVLARCLEPFFTTKERGRGSGLGLSTVYGLTVERGGAVHIDSGPGLGTSVEVWMPRVDEEVDAASEVADSWPAHKKVSGKVLLVEDEDELRRLATAWLEDIGLEVVSASSAEGVLALSGEWSTFDALVTDIVLPGISGVELAGRVRRAEPDISVVYMTGFAPQSTREDLLVPGSRLLRKPYRPDELRLVVASLLAGGQGSKR